MKLDDLMLADLARLWPAIKLIMNATEDQADEALRAYTEQFGRNEGVEALFEISRMFRNEETGME